MNEQSGESQQGSNLRPSRRPSRPRRRGGRGRGRGQTRAQAPQTSEAPAVTEGPIEATPDQSQIEQQEAAPSATSTQHPPRSQLQQPKQPPQRRSDSPLIRAVTQIEEIIRSLRESLRELEDVLEILDDAQRQQIGDEKEIESLRRALSVLQRERQSATREPPRHFEQRRRPENRNRPAAQPASAEPSAEEPSEPAELSPDESEQ